MSKYSCTADSENTHTMPGLLPFNLPWRASDSTRAFVQCSSSATCWAVRVFMCSIGSRSSEYRHPRRSAPRAEF